MAVEPFHARALLRVLVEHAVDFVVVGGMAGAARGSAFVTHDLDIAYGRDRENLEKLAAALHEVGARLRGAPEDVPFILDADSLERGAHFTFDTDSGPLDILDRPDGSPVYGELKRRAGPVRDR